MCPKSAYQKHDVTTTTTTTTVGKYYGRLPAVLGASRHCSLSCDLTTTNMLDAEFHKTPSSQFNAFVVCCTMTREKLVFISNSSVRSEKTQSTNNPLLSRRVHLRRGPITVTLQARFLSLSLALVVRLSLLCRELALLVVVSGSAQVAPS